MDKNTVKTLIQSKIKEHEYEIKGCGKDLVSLKGLKPKDAEEAGRLLILKDKIMFHKSCILALQDVEKDLDNL